VGAGSFWPVELPRHGKSQCDPSPKMPEIGANYGILVSNVWKKHLPASKDH